MDFSRFTSGTKVPPAKCREMHAACRASMAESERQLPIAEDEVLKANDAVRAWVESDGKIELSRRKDELANWRNQVYRHQSDRRHWLLMSQAWRDCMLVHPELADAIAGSKCSHGYATPMCVVAEPALKRQQRTREPGDDDEDAA